MEKAFCEVCDREVPIRGKPQGVVLCPDCRRAFKDRRSGRFFDPLKAELKFHRKKPSCRKL